MSEDWNAKGEPVLSSHLPSLSIEGAKMISWAIRTIYVFDIIIIAPTLNRVDYTKLNQYFRGTGVLYHKMVNIIF